MRVDGATTGAIGPGLLVLLGITHDDTEADCDRLADKVRALRVFADDDGRMNEPLGDRAVLCVSQFTLYGDARKGNRPSYVAAARPEQAEPLYERFCARLDAAARRVRRDDGGRARQRRAGHAAARGAVGTRGRQGVRGRVQMTTPSSRSTARTSPSRSRRSMCPSTSDSAR